MPFGWRIWTGTQRQSFFRRREVVFARSISVRTWHKWLDKKWCCCQMLCLPSFRSHRFDTFWLSSGPIHDLIAWIPRRINTRIVRGQYFLCLFYGPSCWRVVQKLSVLTQQAESFDVWLFIVWQNRNLNWPISRFYSAFALFQIWVIVAEIFFPDNEKHLGPFYLGTNYTFKLLSQNRMFISSVDFLKLNFL